jgi:TldD protein
MTEVNFINGDLQRVRVVENAGCGIRVLVDGCWGFSSTSSVEQGALRESLAQATSSARVLAQVKKNKVKGLADSKMARGEFWLKANGNLGDVNIEQKIKSQRRQSVLRENIPV